MAKKKNKPAPPPPPKKQKPAPAPKAAKKVSRPSKRRVAGGAKPKKGKTRNPKVRLKKKRPNGKKKVVRRKKRRATGETKKRRRRRKGNKKQGGGKRRKKPGVTKRSIADRAYDKYLKKMYVPDDSIISTYDMSNVVRERIKQTVRYETDMPALFSRVLVSAQGIDGSSARDISIERFVAGAFSARIIVQNNGSKDVYLNRDGQAIFNINGGVLKNEEHTLAVTLPSKEMRGGEGAIDVGGFWVQSKDQAQKLGQWILSNQADGGESYSLDVFGNVFLDVGDIVVIEHAAKGLDDSMRFIITSINHSISEGLKTSIGVRKIWPNAGKSFVHRTGVPQNPVLL